MMRKLSLRVFEKHGTTWRAAAFHNTVVRPSVNDRGWRTT